MVYNKKDGSSFANFSIRMIGRFDIKLEEQKGIEHGYTERELKTGT